MLKRSRLISLFLLISLLSLSSSIFAEESLKIGTKEIKDVGQYYAWVERLSIGPTLWSSDTKFPEDQEGVFYRISTTISEIYVSVYIEKLSIGGEGCCKKLLSIRMLDDREFTYRFHIIGEFTEFSGYYWESPTSFVASAMGRTFLFSEIDGAEVLVTEVSKKEDGRGRMKSSTF